MVRLPSRHLDNFDHLRLFLASLVIVSHSPQLIDGNARREILIRFLGTQLQLGDLAVDGFLLLSGYLIMGSWLRKPELGTFLTNRTIRIYPGFIVAALVSAFLIGPLGGNPNYWAQFDPVSFIVRLVTLGKPREIAFPSLPYGEVNSPMWTIRFEFLCYLTVAFLGYFRLLRFRLLILGIGLAATAIHAWQCVVDQQTMIDYPPLNRFSNLGMLPRFFSYFFVGSCFCLYSDRIRYSKSAICWAMLMLIPCLFSFGASQAALPILGGFLLFALAFADFRLLQGFKASADVSYGVYLYAYPIQQLTIYAMDSRLDPTVLSIITIVACYGIGQISWHFVESPFLKLKRSKGVPRVLRAWG